MDSDGDTAEKLTPRRRSLNPLPHSGTLVIDEGAKGDVGSISVDVFRKVLKLSEDAALSESDISYISVAPWRPPTPEPEAKCNWTVVAVRLRRDAGTGSGVQLPASSIALQNIEKAFQVERPDVKSLQGAGILVWEVRPLVLQRVFVRLDGDALSKHTEVQRKFAGGFLPSQGSISRKARETSFPAVSSQGTGVSDAEIVDQTKDEVITAVRKALRKPTVVHCGDFYALPLPTHPITHEAFPPVEVIICEPVNQGLIDSETDIVVDIRWRQQKSKVPSARRGSTLVRSVREEDSDRTAGKLHHASEKEGGQPKPMNGRSAADEESTSEKSESGEEDSSSDESADDMISLSSSLLPARAPGIVSPGSGSTSRLLRRHPSGTTSPGSLYSTFTTPTANQRSYLGRSFQLKPLSRRIPDHLLHPRPSPDEDDEARLFVDVRMLGRLGCFSGDWVRLSVSSQPGDGKDHLWPSDFGGDDTGAETRAIKVYSLAGVGRTEALMQPKSKSARRSSQSSVVPISRPAANAFISPILFASLGQPEKVYLAPILVSSDNDARVSRRRISNSATPPTAREVTLLKVPTPQSTERVMQPGILASLKDHFERRRRIVKLGDRIAISFNINASRVVASMSPNGDSDPKFAELLIGSPIRGWLQQGPTGVAWFQVGQISVSGSTVSTQNVDPAIWGNSACIEPMQTKMMQAGSEYAKEPPVMDNPWRYYFGMTMLPALESGTSLLDHAIGGQEQPFVSALRRRLRQLLTASTSQRAVTLHVKPIVILLHSTQRSAGKIHTASAACMDLGLHLFSIDAYDVLTEGGDGGDVKTEGSLRAKLDRSLTCGAMYTVPLIRQIEALSADRIASVLEETLSDFRVVILTTREIGKVSDGIRSLVTHELEIAAPDEGERRAILQSAIDEKGAHTAFNVDLGVAARKTAAMVAGDLAKVVDRALIARRARLAALCESQPGTLIRDALVAGGPTVRCLISDDMDRAIEAARKSFADAIGAPKIPNVTWEDVGGLAHAKHAILETIQLPLEHPELFAKGLKKRSGILLYGPPGTGKTLLAKAIATSLALNFFSIKGPELLNMYIGESEANVRRVFARARDARPCVVFFDELDAVAPKRGNQGDSGGVMDRIVSQLLAELDGMSSGSGKKEASGADSGGVFVVGATNRPDLLDPALLRPGRFDKMLYLGVAETHEQQQRILDALTRRFALAKDLSLARVAQKLPFTYTGADLYALCADSMLKAMMRQAHSIDDKIRAMPEPKVTPAQYFDRYATEEDVKVLVTEDDFYSAQKQLVTSVSAKELEHYQRVRKAFESSNIDTAERPVQVSGPSASMAAPSNRNASHPPQLMPALPAPTRRTSSSHTMTKSRVASMRKGTTSSWSQGRENGSAAQNGADSSDEDDDDEDDDEAYMTSNDYATTPERRENRDHSPGKPNWKGKGKANATPIGDRGGDRSDAKGGFVESGAFGSAAYDEDLYSSD